MDGQNGTPVCVRAPMWDGSDGAPCIFLAPGETMESKLVHSCKHCSVGATALVG